MTTTEVGDLYQKCETGTCNCTHPEQCMFIDCAFKFSVAPPPAAPTVEEMAERKHGVNQMDIHQLTTELNNTTEYQAILANEITKRCIDFYNAANY